MKKRKWAKVPRKFKPSREDQDWELYWRCLIATTGIVIAVLPIVVAAFNSPPSEWTLPGFLLFTLIFCIGVGIVAASVFMSMETLERFDMAVGLEGCAMMIVVGIVAYPLYRLVKALKSKEDVS